MVYLAMAPIAIEKKNLTLHIKIVVGITKQANQFEETSSETKEFACHEYLW